MNFYKETVTGSLTCMYILINTYNWELFIYLTPTCSDCKAYSRHYRLLTISLCYYKLGEHVAYAIDNHIDIKDS